MKALIELPQSVSDNIKQEAAKEKRSLKAQIEYILINYSNKLVIVEHLKKDLKK